MLEAYIRAQREKRDILLMTHIVLGYPSFDDCMATVEAMVEAGVDLMELQIPFSEPMADGPVILQANARALAAGATLSRCFDFAEEVSKRFDIPFLFMTYYNIVFKAGLERFMDAMVERKIRGAIVPDLPPEEAETYLGLMRERSLAPVFIYSPTTSQARMARLAEQGSGLIYCMARRGVTGRETSFDGQFSDYLAQCRAATDLPLAVGFGVKSAEDVALLKGQADIAVVGSETIRVVERSGVGAVGPFIRSLRPV